MDSLNQYREIIEQTLSRIAAIPGLPETVRDFTVFDRKSDNYLLVSEGWDDTGHVDEIIVHIAIRDGLIWILEDGIEYGVTPELEAAGILKERIVLGFQPPSIRPDTGYAAA
jgi:hypothetical protein